MHVPKYFAHIIYRYVLNEYLRIQFYRDCTSSFDALRPIVFLISKDPSYLHYNLHVSSEIIQLDIIWFIYKLSDLNLCEVLGGGGGGENVLVVVVMVVVMVVM